MSNSKITIIHESKAVNYCTCKGNKFLITVTCIYGYPKAICLELLQKMQNIGWQMNHR